MVSATGLNTMGQRLYINGQPIQATHTDREWEQLPNAESPHMQEIRRFLQEWSAPTDRICVQTSGSTGKPKQLSVLKQHMLESARISCAYFGLTEKKRVLFALPVGYIAGKMMLVRALHAGLDLYPIAPTGHPFQVEPPANIPYDFAPLVPLQIYNSLQSSNETKGLLNCRQLLIGGSALDSDLEDRLRVLPNEIYMSYGMTETLSHIALRRINGTEASPYYQPLAGVRLRIDDEGCLLIDAAHIGVHALHTNDRVNMRPDGTFRVLGRRDQIINTGGIKIEVEVLEQQLSEWIKQDFALTSVPDAKFGEALVLIHTGKPIDVSLFQANVPAHCIPKHQRSVDALPRTDSGKIDRNQLKLLALEHPSKIASIKPPARNTGKDQ